MVPAPPTQPTPERGVPEAVAPTPTLPEPEQTTPPAAPDVGFEPEALAAAVRPPPEAVAPPEPQATTLEPPSDVEPAATAPAVGATPPWYRRRVIWVVGALAVLALIVVVGLRSCGAQGATPQPGQFSGSGDGDFTIDFTVTAAGDVSDLEFNASSDALQMSGTIDDTIDVDDGTFEITLSDGLGLQTLTIEGRFTDGGTAAEGSYDLGLASGVEQQSGPEADASGSWHAELAGGD